MEETVILVLYGNWQMKVILHAYASRKDEISFRLENEVDPDSDFLEKNPVCLVRYRSKYTNRKNCWQGKSKYAK